MRGPAGGDRPGRRAGNSVSRPGRDRRATQIFRPSHAPAARPGPRARRPGPAAWGCGRARRAEPRPVDAAPKAQARRTRRKLRPSFRIAPAAPLLARQRLAQKSGRLGEIRLSHEVQGLAHGVKKARFHHPVLVGNQRKRSASAVLTSAGACSAPSTVINSIVALARSGVTSSAMIARPKTRILSRSPAA